MSSTTVNLCILNSQRQRATPKQYQLNSKVHQKMSMSHPCTTHHSKSKALSKRHFPSDFPYSGQAKEDKGVPGCWRAAEDTANIVTAAIGEGIHTSPEFTCNLGNRKNQVRLCRKANDCAAILFVCLLACFSRQGFFM